MSKLCDGDILINELRVTSYELISLRVAFIARVTSYELRVIFIARVTSYFLHRSFELLFIARVTSYFLHTSYELLFIARVTSYFCCTCYELLFIVRVTSYCLLQELRVTFCIRVTSCLYMRVRSYFLTMSYNRDRDDKAFYDNKVMIKNYSLRSFFDKELVAR